MKRLSILFIFITCLSCNSSFEMKFINSYNNNSESEKIKFEQIFNFQWDKIYIFESYQTPEDINEAIQNNCNCIQVPEYKKLFIFIKNNKIVKYKYIQFEHLTFKNLKNYYYADKQNAKFSLKRMVGINDFTITLYNNKN